MISKHYVALALAVVVAAAGVGCATSQPLKNMLDQPVPATIDGSSQSLVQVKAAIVEGCRAKRWRPIAVGDNEIKCSILVRGKHYAEVTIPYSPDTYSIVYSDSRVLDYNHEKHRIHRNYNKWVILLSQSIQEQFGTS